MAVRCVPTTPGPPVFPGDCVEIFGLTSDSGRKLNGQNGVITRKIAETGRMEIRIGVDQRVTVKPENLRLVDHNAGKVVDKLGFGEADRQAEIEAAAQFRPGDLVTIHDCPGASHQQFNGKNAMVIEDYECPPNRVKVKIDMGDHAFQRQRYQHATLKPENVRKVYKEGLEDAGGGKKGIADDQDRVPLAQLNRMSVQKRHGTETHSKMDMAVEGLGPREPGDPLAPGEVVEVKGLTSEAGQRINGQKGIVVRCLQADGRAEVMLPDGSKKLKFENLERQDLAGGDRFFVEIFGLTSEKGREMNGERGIVCSKSEDTGRYDVKLSKDKKVALKPENLRLLNKLQ